MSDPVITVEDYNRAVPQPNRITVEDYQKAKPEVSGNEDSYLRGLLLGGFAQRNLLAGAEKATASAYDTSANAFHLLDGLTKKLEEATGGGRGGAFEKAELFLRRKAAENARNARIRAGNDTGLAADVTQAVGGLPVGLGTAMPFVSALGPTLGFGALGALSRSGEGPMQAVEGAASGLLTGGLFKVTSGGTSRLARGLTVGSGVAALESAQGASRRAALLSGGVTGALAAIPPGPRRVVVKRGLVGTESEPRKTGQKQEAGSPLIEVMPRTEAQAREFLATDTSTIEVGDRVVNLNLKRIQGPQEFKQVVTKLTELFKEEIQDARRGVITNEQTILAARDLGMKPENLLARRSGQAFNAEELTAARSLNLSVMTEIKSRAEHIRFGNATETEKADFLRLMRLSEATASQVLGATAEAGRALQALRITGKTERQQLRNIRDAVREFSAGGKSLETFADMMADVDTATAGKMARESMKPKASDKLLELWINGLLSGPQTHATNILSNTLVSIYAVPEAYLAGAIGKGRQMLGLVKRGDRVYLREGTERLIGLTEGAKDGLRLAAKAFRDEKVQFGEASKLEVAQRQAISGKFGKAVRIPGRALMAADELYKAVGYRSELRAQALRQAFKEGRTGRDAAARANELIQNPTEQIIDASIGNAEIQTFTNELGRLGRAIQQATTAHPAVRLIFPFIRTPINIVKYSARRSPFGLLMEDVKADLRNGGAAADMASARIALGTGMMLWAVQTAASGRITGSGPTEPESRRTWYASGKQPYAIKIGNQWVSFSRLEPLGTLLGIGADLAEISGQITTDQSEELAAKIVMAFMRNIGNKTFLTGMTGLADALSDPDRYGAKAVQRLAGTLVPTGIAQFNRTQDPVLRDVQSTLEQLKSRLPGYSQDLPPRRNIWGEPIVLNGGWGPDLISPLYQSKESPDKATQEAFRLKARLVAPQRKVKGVELTPQEYSELSKVTGQIAKNVLNQFVEMPYYENLPDGFKRRIFEKTYESARAAGRAMLLGEIISQDQMRYLNPQIENIEDLTGLKLQGKATQ